MQFPVPTGQISSGFREPRPLSNPGLHIHGAIDIAASVGAPIFSPEPGEIIYFFSIRPNKADHWEKKFIPEELDDFPFRDMAYDLYGGIIVLRGRNTGFTHVFTHLYRRPMWHMVPSELWCPWEDKKEERFPISGFISKSQMVSECQHIGNVGSAGYSTGPHVHYEIHHGWRRQDYDRRVNPETISWEHVCGGFNE